MLALSRDAQRLSVNWLILGFMVLFHVGAVVALFFFSWSALMVAVMLHVIAINAGIGMGYHRLLTHRGYQVPRWMEHLLAVCATLSLEGGPLVWVATHRVHHHHADRPGDPHTPHEGGWWSHAGWVIHGSGANAEPALLAKYVPDLMKDDFYRWLNRYHWVPLTLVGFVLLAVGGWSTRRPICGGPGASTPTMTHGTTGGLLYLPAVRAGTTITMHTPFRPAMVWLGTSSILITTASG